MIYVFIPTRTLQEAWFPHVQTSSAICHHTVSCASNAHSDLYVLIMEHSQRPRAIYLDMELKQKWWLT